jgi:adenine-specific DNA-methyltransferase
MNKEDGGSRKYICVQLPEPCEENSEAYKAGYKTISELSIARIKKVIRKILEEKQSLINQNSEYQNQINEFEKNIEVLKEKESPQLFDSKKQSKEIEKNLNKINDLKFKIIENLEQVEKIDFSDLGLKILKLQDSNFKQWQQIEGKDAKALEEQMKLFIDPVAENATIENMVFELLLKSGKDLNCKIERATDYFKINENELVFVLEKATQEIIEAVIKAKPLKVVALDKLFKGNDQLKTNTVLQMKDAGIEFKTI